MGTEPDKRTRRLVQSSGETRISTSISSRSISHPLLKTSSLENSNSNARALARTEASANTSATAPSIFLSNLLNKFSMDDSGPSSLQDQQTGRSTDVSPLLSPAKQSLEGDRNRYSFSSLLSISSMNPASPSTDGKTSSAAGSMRSNTEPASARLDSKTSPLLSMESAVSTTTPTTATDITSVMSTTHIHPQGKLSLFH